jgi:diguanylate cyclase (GGDEF)-like protein
MLHLDVKTALFMTTIMMLLNGAVLGFMHRTLTPDVRPSADDWRIGTLLAAGGAFVLGIQNLLPLWLAVFIGNGFINLGFTLYWRSLRRFNGLPDTPWLFLPAALCTLAIVGFATVHVSLGARIVTSSVMFVMACGAMAKILLKPNALTSERVLAGVVIALLTFAVIRGIYYGTRDELPGSLLDNRNWVATLTPIFITALPVVGTTAFLLMCVERIRGKWEDAAATDFLTNLPNRRTIAATGEARFNAARRNDQPFAVVLVDIDHFKAINDRFGHDAGDRALKHIAGILDENCRGPSMVGRIGGEEFVALIEDADEASALAVAERLRQAIAARPLVTGTQTLPMTASLGVAILAAQDEAFGALLNRADHALYQAKQTGRNKVVFHSLAA